MIENRRAFLKGLSLSVAGASLVALPGQALAFGRRRHSSSCDVVVPVCDRVVPVDESSSKQRQLFRGGDILLSFPLDGNSVGDPYPINGNGSFITWGKWTADVVGISKVSVVDAAGATIMGSSATEILPPNWLMHPQWAYAIKGVPTGVPFRLKFEYGKLVSGQPQAFTLTFGYFQCSSAFEP